jgi:hypothetical protein
LLEVGAVLEDDLVGLAVGPALALELEEGAGGACLVEGELLEGIEGVQTVILL